MAKYCSNCGKEINSEMKYCPMCGEKNKSYNFAKTQTKPNLGMLSLQQNRMQNIKFFFVFLSK